MARMRGTSGEWLLGAVFLTLLIGALTWWGTGRLGIDPQSWRSGLLTGIAVGAVAGIAAASALRGAVRKAVRKW